MRMVVLRAAIVAVASSLWNSDEPEEATDEDVRQALTRAESGENVSPRPSEAPSQ